MTPSRPLRQRGGALILALLIAALVAVLASAALADYGRSLDHVAGRHDQAQARWLARGAIDWARNVLEDDARRNGALDHYGEAWALRVPPTPVEEGEVSGELTELSGRFNINSVVTGGRPDPRRVDVLLRLLHNLGLPPAQAQTLTAALIDAIDPDQQTSPDGAETDWYVAQGRNWRPPDAPLLALEEFAQLRGASPALLPRLRPHLSALPPRARRVNINTASGELLAALLPGLDIDAARARAARRLARPYRSLGEFILELPPSVKRELALLAVRSDYFLATGRARWGEATVSMEVLLERPREGTQRPNILWSRLL